MRRPLAHAASLRRQHANFVRRHAEDPFTWRYMRDLAHYEFGALHRPVLFDEFRALSEGFTPSDLDCWLAYWIAAFEHVRRCRGDLHILGYEQLCDCPDRTGTLLCELLGLGKARAADIGRYLRPVRNPDPELEAHGGALRDRAEALHALLLAG